jgi:hypothetical protein
MLPRQVPYHLNDSTSPLWIVLDCTKLVAMKISFKGEQTVLHPHNMTYSEIKEVYHQVIKEPGGSLLAYRLVRESILKMIPTA